MKDKLLWILLAFTLAAPNTTQAVALLMPLEQQPHAALLSAKMISRHHYRHVTLDDSLSSQIFDNYLKMLDSEKIFFLHADIVHFADARTRLDDAILDGNLGIPFAIFNLYQQRMTERFSYARSLLANGFDFTKKENYQLSRKNAPWPKSKDELNDLWRKRVKNDWLNLKLAGKDNQSIVETLGKR